MHYGTLDSRLLAGTAIVASGSIAATAQAQESGNSGIQEIIVTAQKREQSIQDVPIAITALGQDALAANKIENVANLTGLVPGLVMRNTAGALSAISFAMRGVNSNPSAPLQDKQTSAASTLVTYYCRSDLVDRARPIYEDVMALSVATPDPRVATLAAKTAVNLVMTSRRLGARDLTTLVEADMRALCVTRPECVEARDLIQGMS